MAMALRDGHASSGVAPDQCRQFARMVGAHTLRFLLAAARTLWFIGTSEQHVDVALRRFRPWYRHKVAPSQFDVAWACREVLVEAGIFPYLGFSPLWLKISKRVIHQSPLRLEATKLMTRVVPE